MKLRKLLNQIYKKEYFILLGIGFFPLLWKVLEISFLTGFDDALKVLGQIALISIIFKVFEETLLNPLYKILGENYNNSTNDRNIIARKFLFWFIIATVTFTILLSLIKTPIMKISQVPDSIFSETSTFLKIYIIACGFGLLCKYLFTFNVISQDTKKMFLYLLIKAIGSVLFFIIFVPKFTLGLGVEGIAITELIVNLFTLLYLVLSFPKTTKTKANLNKKEYFKLLVFALLETLIRNVVYYCVILVFLNILNNQDLYYVANDYIWSIMLIPTLAQSTLIKQYIANNKNYSLKPYFINSIFLILFMILLIPLSLLIFKYVYNLDNYMGYFIVLLKLFPCYIIFVFDSIIEAYFFATGKLHHILIQNILTNIFVYLTAFILWIFNIWEIKLDSIILLFNIGVIISSIYTILVYVIEKRHKVYPS